MILFAVLILCLWQALYQHKEKHQGEEYYILWFVFDSNASVYYAFCSCQGGTDQGCRYIV